jgi:hypothetical protein
MNNTNNENDSSAFCQLGKVFLRMAFSLSIGFDDFWKMNDRGKL